ncbi:hypothetical protein TNCV_2704131 [Trichonephila clavipes]|nr:hypothetical protein TNCV_2704131 [Trichonephila clavipes]
MPSPVQSNCDAHDTIANGQYGAVWSMGHTQQRGTLHQASSPFMRLVEGEERWEVYDHSQSVLFQIGVEPNQIVMSFVVAQSYG